jgi:uridine kinase
LKDLIDGKEVECPVYNFNISRRENFTETIKPAKLIIFEGILSLYDKRVRTLMDMTIFVDTDDDIRLARRSNII